MSHKKSEKDKNVIKEYNLTYDDYASQDDGNRYELAGGKLELMSPSPSTTHQLVSSEIYEQIARSCKTDYYIFYAPIDVILSVQEVRQPDIALVSQKRMDILTNRGIEGAPDLVAEIISPSSLKRDKIDKLTTYAHFKIPEYWIVDPNLEALEQYILTKERYKLTNIFQDHEPITSPNIACISFSMKHVMGNIPRLD
ncbi:Endonuclease, Uma2 family (restriction endonuclease fold) [Lentibacillus halodurans]|uniref:Endonuclease, Uma2 family (Restriction endonuclease fold) n=1 Tax=Lentibacillus halodurans TaxID=237679 RepID=A0A1I0YDD9_9BACI|nr:Uma2 family endonuclease [Lentibacillus halodurans]SFB10223.1 Endonuclease, Uma2 family (restriction endonuclease fold) [Lentibacillus halodurans]